MAIEFTKYQKRLAFTKSQSDLKANYELTEKNLSAVARRGTYEDLDKAMKLHQQYEYALLYQKTPQFRACQKMKRKKYLKFG